MNRIFTILILCTFLHPSALFAARFKGAQPSSETRELIVLPSTNSSDLVVSTTSSKNFTVKNSFKKNRLGFRNTNNKYLPVVLAVKPTGRNIMSVQKAVKLGVCSDALGYTVARRSATRMKFSVRGINGESAYANLRNFRIAGRTVKARKSFARLVDKSVTTLLASDCSPAGNATNSGYLGVTSSTSVNLRAEDDGDRDGDGLPDLFDSDADANGILNPFDPSFIFPFKTFKIFSNLKVSLEGVVNSNTGTTPSLSDVNALLSNSSILAIEVVGDADSGETSELDCGTLGYCSAGGSGEIALTSTAFPDDVDADSDGFGEITKGSTGDFQLMTGAELGDLNAGDILKQIVADSSGAITNYFAKLDFVFKSTPAVVSVTDDASSDVNTISYPVSDGDNGTPVGTCFPVTVNGDGEVSITVVAWRPQRKGFAPIGETGDFYDVGGSEITIDIPNKPDPGLMGAGRFPNNCSATTYTESDPNLTIADDMLKDTASDTIADAANTVTFSVNLTQCLAESSDTFAVGDKLSVGVQFRSIASSEGSDNAAVSFCVQRTVPTL